ncbi:toprim domain-containing protein, partial [Candidatus Latescibacterota bacterium]
MKILKKKLSVEINKIKVFEQHGFVHQGETGNQAYGICPFCSKEKHFYINKETRQWDCKSCGEEGGHISFLKQISEHTTQFFKGKIANELARDRGIRISTFCNHGIGYNPNTEQYLIPVKNSECKKVNIKLYKIGGNLIGMAGCKVSLYNLEKLTDKITTIWLCEGEFDTLALDEALKSKSAIALGVPGASTFKPEWIPLFSGRKVYILYDNDDAGRKGVNKVRKSLDGNVEILKWEDYREDGFDINDLYKEYDKPRDFTRKLRSYFEEERIHDKKLVPISLDGVKTVVKKWLYFEDYSVVDVCLAVIIANRMQADPLWMFLIAPPGGSKTELLRALKCEGVTYELSSLTEHTLVSGLQGVKDMLFELNDKVVIMKDFTTVLSMRSDPRLVILGQLREIYDGQYKAEFGNRKKINWEGKVGFLAGVT